MKYYFAYGSNLNKDQMYCRCPESRKIGSFILNGYRLLFRKHHKNGNCYLTIEKAADESVPIGIFEISDNDEKTLDKREGVETDCYKKEYIDIIFNGENINGLVYIMVNPKKAAPQNDYYERVKQGYNDFGFDLSYLEEARQECEN